MENQNPNSNSTGNNGEQSSGNKSKSGFFGLFGSSKVSSDTNNVANSAYNSSQSDIESSNANVASATASSSSSVSSITSMFSNISRTNWIIIIIILAILGFNIFVYLAKGTQVFAQITAYFAGLFGTGVAETTKQVTNTAATGTKVAVDATAGAVNTTVDATQQVASNVKNANYNQQAQLNSSLSKAKTEQKESGYSADESSSTIQSNKSTGKAGWCYIGEDRGFRSCAQVGVNDKCMSGDIYDSQELCMNPELRP
jgi:hypothetical protein